MKQKINLILSILFGGLLANTGLNKLLPKDLKYMPKPEMLDAAKATMRALVESGWIWEMVGISQIIGGILLMIPRFRALGSIVLLPVNIGIFLFHAIQDAPERMPMSIMILAINIWFVYDCRKKYKPLFNK